MTTVDVFRRAPTHVRVHFKCLAGCTNRIGQMLMKNTGHDITKKEEQSRHEEIAISIRQEKANIIEAITSVPQNSTFCWHSVNHRFLWTVKVVVAIVSCKIGKVCRAACHCQWKSILQRWPNKSEITTICGIKLRNSLQKLNSKNNQLFYFIFPARLERYVTSSILKVDRVNVWKKKQLHDGYFM